ncbi:hypothetical protein CANCADRAFT_128061 [Tortispora caseinolytica NRRL Y-17796]|uniref:PX domain-containing protein n=1 Tax=Tortispora caseinolytica NRRL Y-17796 TaxID=767744 RepID=A0A1E4TAQ5_9ASCO|nr:hypothetical protein CANCADRAFT_128061 [Tortispora caseinolytica NRRL Y-17796]
MLRLDGIQEHYLKRELISQQTTYEFDLLSRPGALGHIGRPFKGVSTGQFQLINYMLNKFVKTFPFVRSANEKEFWQDNVQVFIEMFLGADLSTVEDHSENLKRQKITEMLRRLVEICFSSGIKTKSGLEDATREQRSIRRLATASSDPVHPLPSSRLFPPSSKASSSSSAATVTFIDVVGVQMISKTTSKAKSTKHARFIVKVFTSSDPKPIYVFRRYGDFRRLHKSIKLVGKLPRLPPKVYASSSLVVDDVSGQYTVESDSESVASIVDGAAEIDGLIGASSAATTDDNTSVSSANEVRDGRYLIYRERQRLQLKTYLSKLADNPKVTKTRAFKDFITKGSKTSLDKQSLEDIHLREKYSELRANNQREFLLIAKARSQDLEAYMSQFRSDLIRADGLTRLFNEIKRCAKLEQLSERYSKLVEWFQIEVAATLYHLFLGEDWSEEFFHQMKHIHHLLPYRVLRNILWISNPMTVMKSLMDLFMAQPFGRRSLFQRILGMTFSQQIREQNDEIAALQEELADDAVCDRLSKYIDLVPAERNVIKDEAEKKGCSLVYAIASTSHLGPGISHFRLQRVMEGEMAYNKAIESDAGIDTLTTIERKRVSQFVALNKLLKCLTRKRDNELLSQIFTDNATLSLCKQMFVMFYGPLAYVYKSADIYQALVDFQNFADDLIKVVNSAMEEVEQTGDLVQKFIALVEKHSPSFYRFLHDIYVNDNGFFGEILQWVEGLLSFLRVGYQEKIDMQQFFEDASEIVGAEALVEETNRLIEWKRARKAWKLRKAEAKMGAGDEKDLDWSGAIPIGDFTYSDFGLEDADLEDFESDEEEAEEQTWVETIEAERTKMSEKKNQEPAKPELECIPRLRELFSQYLKDIGLTGTTM